jgi:hypothetical protein
MLFGQLKECNFSTKGETHMTEKQMLELISQVEEKFAAELKKAEEAVLPENNEASVQESVETIEKNEDSEKKDDKKDEDKKEDKKDDEEHDYDDEDMDVLDKTYGKMGKAELNLHKKFIQKYSPDTMAKSEIVVSEVQLETILKSEYDLVKAENEQIKADSVKLAAEKEALAVKHDELQKSFDTVRDLLSKLNTKTSIDRKTIANLEVIKKSDAEVIGEKTVDQMAKTEVLAILNKKVMEPTLSIADRRLVNEYCINNGSLESIKHLLK